MPYIKIQTNQPVADKKEALKKLSAVSAKAIGKPETYVQTALEADAEMTFGGTGAPTAFIQCKSIGLSSSQTEGISAALCAFCENELQVPQNRVYIEFAGAAGNMWGWKGGTF
jgi:phenylpyruvate tautomerase